ncbi:MAG: cation transporter [Alphaproteobacteria bacterium]|nr:cation transporter [Alphaproteobacteria bacterium]
MRRLFFALSLGAALLTAGAVMAAERSVRLAVDNMYCASCPYIVKHSLAKVAGVGAVSVSFAKKTATVTYDDQQTTLAALIAATTQAGYPSHVIQ